MPTKYLPSSDQGLRSWLQAFDQNLSSNPESFGVTRAVSEAFSQKVAAFSAALGAATDPQTRGNMTVFRKDEAKADLISFTRSVVRSIQGCMTVNDIQRQALGITVRVTPIRIAKPEARPSIDVRNIFGRQATLRTFENGTTNGGKPNGVAGINVYCVIANEPPEDMSQWTLLASSTRARFTVTLPAQVTPGTMVWLCASYFNPRSQSGPTGNPITLTVGSVSIGLKLPPLAA